MKRFKLFLFIIPVLAIFAALAIVSTASTSSEDGKARVWVEFAPGTKGQVQRALNAAGAEFHYEFDDLNAVVISVPEQALAGLSHNPNIISIEEDAKRYLNAAETPYGVDMVQARDVWDIDRDGVIDEGASTGEDRIVCIIDSGLFTAHEDFAGVNILGGYPTTSWNTDTCGHGTHVAGTIAAALNDVGVVGVTPGTTSLYIVKVFGDNCAWTYSSTLADAANRCSTAGANVISMSLGGAKSSTTEKRAFDTIYSKGILSIAAAGNEGTTALNYPAGYSSVVSVAAIDENKVVADFSQFNSDVELAAPGVGVRSTVPYIETNTVTVDGIAYTGGHIEYAPYGTASGALVDGGLCDATGAWSGKVVLCQRGTIDFYTKVMNVQSSRGAAALIYNNEPGNFLGTLGEGFTSTIPALSLSQEDGQYLVANKLGSLADTFSAIAWNVSGYEYYDGTSMATPHVSAVAALIWSKYPTLTNVQIRNAMNNTAMDLGTAGRDIYYGFGLVQAKAALDSLGGGSGGGTLSLAVATNKTSYVTRETVTITVTVKDQNNVLVSGATVNVKMTTANGKIVNYSGTTNTSGVATFTHKVSSKTYGVGTYRLDATAAKTGYTTATGTKTFEVTK